MITYRVGGAVRDKLLGIPAKENDWVVVGSTPDELLSSGYTPVGKDFPVFLHPQSREEYALARTERKTGHGYHGFHFHASPEVTLEQDLLRRDLTINAIAEDAAGNLVDPYGGQRDIEARLLRHVSPAFAEDPVRVLRVARFAARFSPYGFAIAPETMCLMQQIVDSNELDHLVAERIWKETVRALSEDFPVVFFRVLRECGALKKIFPELENLFGVPQRADYHPEIDCGVHALLSLEQAALLSTDPAVRFAALVHDLGKATTPTNVLPSHTAHEARSVPLIRTLCTRLTAPNDFRDLALLVARYHTDVHRAMELRPSTILKLFDGCDVWRRPQRFPMILAACKADARGRTTFENASYRQADYLAQCMDAARSIDNNALINSGYSGIKLGQKIQEERLQKITRIKAEWGEHANYTDK